ncbi:zeta toxin family protein [Capnocytophaga catalasegens]|uniref:Zeta toxin domain-containing protein n=1 Tax=Capnocytophaga catalasegens TaxID=1004260 RepID=A0AAV5AYJ1_9FLAO|nr:zeta toxin family protein [Capnocytophaga catalasegens]GIZ15509.1 hypothetical protein RCZ03_15090 [Capnocytophaga catalasegens]GJM49852.1 hypothetical protein RCZ15_08270 [Capnocytophaga catalasegens]GJM54024.1 hypothetical protein RCZ16_23400 [Capnocytophaga catalasegens]
MNIIDKKQISSADRVTKKINRLYHQIIKKVSVLSSDIKGFDDEKPFDFSKYPKIKKQVDILLKSFSEKATEIINQATKKEWLEAVKKNNSIVTPYLKRKLLTKEQITAYTNRNDEALQAFQTRKTNGLNLSDRIWKYTNQFRNEIEMSLDLGLSEGRSAQQISRDIRKYLQEPNLLFRRVRDKRGNLHLSKRAQKHNVGQGVYRSSYKNAIRVARTEVNMAYRASDMEKYKQFDFVLGYEIKRSNNVFGCSVCENLKGKYPKDFQFLGWHPQCRCYTVPILQNVDDFIKDLQGKETEKEYITDVPDNFKQWVSDNKERIDNAQSLPLWLKENEKFTPKEKILTIEEIKDYIRQYKTTEDIFKKNEEWIFDRKILHQKIIKEYFSIKKTESDKVYMLGGAPANGKSTLTESGLLSYPNGLLVIDPDKIKSMIPEYKTLLHSHNKELIMLAANFVHEESSYLSKKIREKALTENWGTIIDGINDGTADKIHSNAQLVKKLSGKKIRADYVSLDTDLSIKLAKMRAEKTGRYVQLSFISDMNKSISKEFSKILKNKSFDELYLWDTNIEDKPRLILQQIEGKIKIIDKSLYIRFLQKAE